ncbi:MAG TPA: enolase C-terminal domain-like protein [Candidatus Acidoferrales bacterium]|nr:enolase C-terminal domain-like protein [Candidatus Acidoferrales bacterium]
MKITSIKAVPFTIPYHHSIVAASGTLSCAEHVLVRVNTDEGLFGISEACVRSFVYGESQASIVEAIRLWFEPALIGADPFAVEENYARIAWVVANNTARGAVDIALHDLRGKITGLPSWRLLGGSGTSMRVTHILTMGGPSEAADEACEAVGQYGITSFKIKVGSDIRGDVARVAAVRRAVGEDASIYVDANHGWSAEHAIRALTAMADYNVDVVEEPSPAEDRIGRQRLALQVPIPIMADESAPTLGDAARELILGSARALSIKTTRTGFTESARLVALASALGARTLIGAQADSMIGAAAGLAFGSAYPRLSCEPGELDYYTVLTDQLVAEPLEVTAGHLNVSQLPGIGVVIDEDKLRHYRIDRQ